MKKELKERMQRRCVAVFGEATPERIIAEASMRSMYDLAMEDPSLFELVKQETYDKSVRLCENWSNKYAVARMQNDQLAEALREADKYLNEITYVGGNKIYLNNIGYKSILHKQMQTALANFENNKTS